MKKYFACAAALSLMVAACGDDSSSNANGGEKGTTPAGKEIAHAGNCGVFTPWEGEGEAFVIGSKDGGYQVLLPKMDYNVAVCYKCLYERSGDTLHIWDSDTTREALNWFCTTDIWFDISDVDTDIKYFKYEDTVFEIVEGPAPGKISSGMVVTSSSSENPSSSGSVESSSSQGTSSAVQPGESSSSVIPPGSSSSDVPGSSSGVTPPSSSSRQIYNGPVPLKSITATCQERIMTTDPVEPVPPEAYLGISNSFAEIKLFNVDLSFACDSASQKVFWDSLNAGNTVASVIGDTLFVNFKRFDEKGVEYKCGCTADVEFTFDEQYLPFGYTAFENNRPPLELGYILVNQPDPTYQKVEEADAQCVKEPGSGDPMVDAALPPVAHMYVNGDSAQIVVERVMVTCGMEFESVEIRMEDSALYVTPHYDPSSTQADCLCSSKVGFNVKMVDVYKEATILVFDDGTSYNLGNKMRLIVE